MTATPADPAARLGYQDAARILTAQYAAGVDLDTIAAHHNDVGARLLANAHTSAGRAYAREYSETAASLVADLRQDAAASRAPEPRGAPSPGRGRPACTLPDGTPHPDPVLAEKGWHVDRGIYTRGPAEPSEPGMDREAA